MQLDAWRLMRALRIVLALLGLFYVVDVVYSTVLYGAPSLKSIAFAWMDLSVAAFSYDASSPLAARSAPPHSNGETSRSDT
ncbi:hypothetical protein [Lysobacter sp.]|uniref:hypothetical protein n=1 Tax=Lysobacter sp. TaxID=72226 RepID=UPI002D3538DD|nr:hypothetical protein [Lysobacter sp.]HZX77382.1 hypothetical protein [Lysobacter sp.]